MSVKDSSNLKPKRTDWFWVAWLVAFLVVELWAAIRKTGGTLSEFVWRVFKVSRKVFGGPWRRWILVGFAADLLIHFWWMSTPVPLMVLGAGVGAVIVYYLAVERPRSLRRGSVKQMADFIGKHGYSVGEPFAESLFTIPQQFRSSLITINPDGLYPPLHKPLPPPPPREAEAEASTSEREFRNLRAKGVAQAGFESSALSSITQDRAEHAEHIRADEAAEIASREASRQRIVSQWRDAWARHDAKAGKGGGS